MNVAAEPELRLPRRALQIESGRLLDRSLEIVREFRAELAGMKLEVDSRMNASLDPGAGLFSFYNGLGYGGGSPYGDPQSGVGTLALANSYFPVTMNWTLLAQSYMTQGLFRIVIDQVVDDAFGDGVTFKSALLDPEELVELNRAFRTARDRDSYQGTRGQRINFNAGYDLSNSDMEACKLVGKWGRLFGGAGLIVNTTQRMESELNVEALGPDTPLTFIAADRWELVLDQIGSNSDTNPTPYDYYGNRLHRSRVGRFVWTQAPSRIRQRLGGWGMSTLEECIRPVNAYLKFEKLIFELMDEAKVDVYKIKGFNASLATAKGTQALINRVQVANQAKNFQNALTMDIEDEYEQKQLGSLFPGLAAFYQELRINLCGYMKIPMNKLFGESAGGFGSGKDSLDNYNSTVRNFRTGMESVVMRAGSLRCQQMFSIVPEDLEVEWEPLAVLDGVEQEAVKTSQQTRIAQRFQLGLTTGKEALDEMRKAELLDIEETEVEQGLRDVEPPMTENPDEAEAGRDHDLKMQKAGAQDKKQPGAKKPGN